ncbi:hypothetical protein GCM10027578_12490 [Spirosoma luteolum]
MKKDNLERFVRDNREAFDHCEPPDSLWDRIDQRLGDAPAARPETPAPVTPDPARPFVTVHRSPAPATRWLTDWRVAAAVALLLLAAGGLYLNQQYGVAHQPEMVAANPGYAKAVVQYTELIDQKQQELRQMTQDNPALYQEFSSDLSRLERSYQSLKADLPQNPNQETLLQAMIQNLQIQIDLLNEQLRVIQRIKKQTHENPV